MIGTDINKAKRLLESDELVAIPTETVYGLAANATSPEAVLKIYAAKERPFFDPLISHFYSFEQVKNWLPSIPEKAEILATNLWPGSLTLILPKSDRIPDLVCSGLDFMGVRVPKHPLTRNLLKSIDFPLAAPSANPFGYVSPTSAKHVDNQLGKKIKYILDGGACEVGVESTIVSFKNPEQPAILRHGGISREIIESLIGKVSLDLNKSSNPDAPGQLKKHYSPNTHFELVSNLKETLQNINTSDKRIAIITFGSHKLDSSLYEFSLSKSEDLTEAASRLFSILREIDEKKFDLILSERVPSLGIGMAINDRLERAASKS